MNVPKTNLSYTDLVIDPIIKGQQPKTQRVAILTQEDGTLLPNSLATLEKVRTELTLQQIIDALLFLDKD